MCSPAAAMFGTSMGLQAIGGYMSYNNIKAQGDATGAYYDMLAKQNEYDAKTVRERAKQQEGEIQYAASLDENKISAETKKLEGRQKTVMAANGVFGDSVTAQDIARDTVTKEAMDKAVIRYNANTKSWATELDAIDTAYGLKKESAFNRLAGNQARRASRTEALASLLGSSSQIANTGATWWVSRGKGK